MPSPVRPDSLACITYLWCTQQGLILLFSSAKGFLTPFEILQVVLLAASFVSAASHSLWCYCVPLAGALAARIVANTIIFPMMWESHLWCAQTDLSLLLGLLGMLATSRQNSHALDVKNGLAESVAITVRWQMAWFYAGAAFWKLNTSFLDHRYSCAPLFFSSILAAYLPPEVATPTVTDAILRAGPLIIVVGEFVIAGALILAAHGRCQGAVGSASSKVGVVLALCLHLGIAVTPPPNNVGAFSVIMAARLVFFAPSACARLLRDLLLPRSVGAVCRHVLALALAASATALASYGAHFVSKEEKDALDDIAPTAAEGGVGQLGIMFFKGLDWSVPTFMMMMWVVGGGVLSAQAQAPPANANAAKEQRETKDGGARRMSPGGHALTLLSFVHSFVVTPLGLQDLGGPNMYSNLRMQGGSNHLLLPTSLLHQAAAASSAAASPFGGGVVRIERSSSARINSLYPGEITSVHSRRARALLARVGHSGRQFNPAMGRVLGSWVLPPLNSSVPLTRYTVPALEFRRMLAEARESARLDKAAFEVEYTRLGVPPAGMSRWMSHQVGGGGTGEQWRTSGAARGEGGGAAFARTYTIAFDREGVETCREVGGGECSGGEMAQVAGLGVWEGLLGVWNPHPIVENMTQEMHCFGP